MKKTKLISLFLALAATLTCVAGCGGRGNQTDDTTADTTIAAADDTTASVETNPAETEPKETLDIPEFPTEPKPIVYPDFSGVVLSMDADTFSTYDFAADGNTQVTDILIDSDNISADKLGAIEDDDLLVWVATDFLEDRDAVKANVDRIIADYGAYIDGIEIDFTNAFYEDGYNKGDDGENYYKAYANITEFMKTVHDATSAANLSLSARVGTDLNTNADYGFDVAGWAAKGLVERVAPTAGGDATDTCMPVRLWASVLNTWDEENKPFVVELTPRIEKTLYNAPGSQIPNTRETIIGTAALMLGQGADKICIDATLRGEDVLSVIGSYNTAKAENRRLLVTVNPYVSKWGSNFNFPVNQVGLVAFMLHVPMGPIDADSTAVLKFSAPAGKTDKYPTVYVNSELCEYLGTEENPAGVDTGVVHCFKIPHVAYDMYAVAEVQVANANVVKYAEVAITVAK